jgi:hypothetical protein
MIGCDAVMDSATYTQHAPATLMLHHTWILIICARKLLIVCANTNSIEPSCVCVCESVKCEMHKTSMLITVPPTPCQGELWDAAGRRWEFGRWELLERT